MLLLENKTGKHKVYEIFHFPGSLLTPASSQSRILDDRLGRYSFGPSLKDESANFISLT